VTSANVTIPASHVERFINDLVNGNVSPVAGWVVLL